MSSLLVVVVGLSLVVARNDDVVSSLRSRAAARRLLRLSLHLARSVLRINPSAYRPLSASKTSNVSMGGSVAEWLACWTQAQKAWVQIAAATLSGNSLRQTVHTHCASVHQAAKFLAALLRVAGVTAGLAESNGSLPPGL